MRKKKTETVAEAPPEVKETLQEVEKEEIVQPEKEKATPSLEDDFADFEKSVSEFKPETEKTVLKNDDGELIDPSTDLANQFKVKMFMGFACFLLEGFNTFLFNLVMKKDIAVEDMKLNERERQAIEKYMYTPQILEWLAKIPPYVWMVVHIEYMFFQKYQFAVKMKKLKEKDEPEEEKEVKPKKKK